MTKEVKAMKTTTTTTEVKITTNAVDLDKKAAEALIAEFNAAKIAIKALEAKKQDAEKALREMLGGNEVGIIDGVERVRIVHRNLSKIDREALKAAFPEAYAAVLVESPYTVLQAK